MKIRIHETDFEGRPLDCSVPANTSPARPHSTSLKECQ